MKNYSSLPINNQNADKGSLISESFSTWLRSPKEVPNHDPLYVESAHAPDLAPFFADLSQSEKLSEV